MAQHLPRILRRLLKFKSKTDTVILALRELIRRRRLEELKGLGPARAPRLASKILRRVVISVDTSVWISAFRTGDGPEAMHLRELLDADLVVLAAPVRLEILEGTSHRDLARLRRALSALPVVFPTESTWQRIDGWVSHAVRTGQRFGIAHVIAAIAAEREDRLWSIDRDFDRVSELRFIELHRPR